MVAGKKAERERPQYEKSVGLLMYPMAMLRVKQDKVNHHIDDGVGRRVWITLS